VTPTLYGRWQTRFLLLSTIGFLVSLAIVYFAPSYDLVTLIVVLIYVVLWGLAWDILYNYLQQYRWDHDWPPFLQLAAGLWEAIFLWGLFNANFVWDLLGAKGPYGIDPGLTVAQFSIHYSLVWFTTFLASQGLLRIIFLRWRFNGGEWI